MKKLLMTAAIAAAIISSGQMNAQIKNGDKAIQEQTTQDTFQEMKISELPATVTDAVKVNFEGANIGKAYVNDQKQYKLVLEIDGIEKTVYANAKGEWIKPENK